MLWAAGGPEASMSNGLVMRPQHHLTHIALPTALWTQHLLVASPVDLGLQEIWLLYCFLIKSASLLNFTSLPLAQKEERRFPLEQPGPIHSRVSICSDLKLLLD